MQLLRMGWLVHSPLTMQIWANSLGVAEIGWTSVEQFAAFGGGVTWRVRVLIPSMTTPIIRPAF